MICKYINKALSYVFPEPPRRTPYVSDYKSEVNPYKKDTYRVVILPNGLVAHECESFYGSSMKHPCYHYFTGGMGGTLYINIEPRRFVTNKFGRIDNIAICSGYGDAERKGGWFLKDEKDLYSGL